MASRRVSKKVLKVTKTVLSDLLYDEKYANYYSAIEEIKKWGKKNIQAFGEYVLRLVREALDGDNIIYSFREKMIIQIESTCQNSVLLSEEIYDYFWDVTADHVRDKNGNQYDPQAYHQRAIMAQASYDILQNVQAIAFGEYAVPKETWEEFAEIDLGRWNELYKLKIKKAKGEEITESDMMVWTLLDRKFEEIKHDLLGEEQTDPIVKSLRFMAASQKLQAELEKEFDD